MDWEKAIARRDESHLSCGIWCALYNMFYGNQFNSYCSCPFDDNGVSRTYNIWMHHKQAHKSHQYIGRL